MSLWREAEKHINPITSSRSLPNLEEPPVEASRRGSKGKPPECTQSNHPAESPSVGRGLSEYIPREMHQDRCNRKQGLFLRNARCRGEACTGLVEIEAMLSWCNSTMTVHLITVGCRESWRLSGGFGTSGTVQCWIPHRLIPGPCQTIVRIYPRSKFLCMNCHR